MKKRSYLPFVFFAVIAAALFLASSPPRWMAAQQDPGQTGQSPSTGPQPDVGETVIVPKKKTQPSPDQPSTNNNNNEPTTVAPPPKPEKINPNDIYTLSTSTNLVNVDVMVVDNNGAPIHTLERKNFKLFDDGVPQAISNFGTGEAPMTVCLLIDYANRWWPFLYVALRYSYTFLEVIHPQDWIAVVSFDLNTKILTDFTQDRAEARQGLDQLRLPGFSESNFYDSLAFVLDRMKEVHGRKAVVAVVTGLDTMSKLTYDQMLKIARASDTPVYPVSILEMISFQSPRSEGVTALQAENGLRTIAAYSGGQAYFPRFEQDVPGDYQQIADSLRQQYSLGFIPTNATKDGQFHKLKVSLVDEQGNPLEIFNQKGKKVKYKVVARDGYYSPKS
jgi:VWFA-related protein